jgi:hypothetical protein
VIGWALVIALACGCGAARPDGASTRETMQADPRYDFLLGETRAIYRAHVHADPARVALVRAALARDARPEVRRNAIVALTAAQQAAAVPDYIAALDDAAPVVAAEASAALAVFGPARLSEPASEPALAALRAHAARLRALLGAPEETVRFDALAGLTAIADPEVPLAAVLGDASALIRRQALELAGARTLGAADVAALGAFAASDPDAELRVRAVNLVVSSAPQLAAPVVVAALARGDADRSTASLVADAGLVALVPAILAYLKANPREPYFFATLAAFGATCAAPTIAQLAHGPWSEAFAIDALAKLSGHPDWPTERLLAWASAQPPCP